MTVDSLAGVVCLRPLILLRRTPVALAIGLALCSTQGLMAAETVEETVELEEITVTGTRIRNVTGMDMPTPVAAISSDELLTLSPSSVTEALAVLPQFYNNPTSENFGSVANGNGFFQSPGGGSMNLRGIGSKRTLTMLDGHRMVSSTAFGGPDISLFPDQMLKRIEAVTGGASAAYGTDAVAGVVNYILDTEFEGIRASAQAGVTERGDGENQKYSLAFGHALGERSHALFSAGYSRQDGIFGYQDRNWYQSCGLMQNTTVPANVAVLNTVPPLVPAAWNEATYVSGNGGYSADAPRLVPACGLHNNAMTLDGLISWTTGTGPSAVTTRYELLPDGSVVPFVRTLPATGPAAASGIMVGGGGQDLEATSEFAEPMPYSDRKNVFGYLDYDVSDNTKVYAQALLGWQTLRHHGRIGDALPGPPQQLTIYRNNAFLPPALATIMDANGRTEVTMTRAGVPGTQGTWENDNRTTTATLGFRSNIASEGFFSGWSIDGYAQYGQNKLDAAQIGGMRLDRVYLATDAVVDSGGNIRCNVTVVSGLVPDCVPLNVFGRGNASAEAVEWITGFDPGVEVTTTPFIGYDDAGLPLYADETYSYVGDEAKHRLVKLEQTVFEVTASGRIFDGWAGPVSAAIGAHWREESIDQKVQAPQGNSAADGTYFPVWCPDGAVATNARCIAQVSRGIRPPGAIGVRGVAPNPFQNTVEFQFSNVPFVSGTFNVKEAFAETIVPLVANQPWMRDLNFQGAVRWADYSGSGSIWSWKVGLDAAINDEVRLRGTFSQDTRAANIAERFDRTGGFTLPINDRVTPLPTGWTNPTAVTTVSGGNPLLEPEQGETFTVGLVYRPLWLNGLDMSVDWLKVSLKEAIEQLPAQRVIDSCYFEGDTEQCARIVRDTNTNVILFVPQTYENLAKTSHESVDLEIGYSRAVQLFGGNERMGARLFGTYLIENSITNSQGVKTDLTGNVPLQYFEKKAVATFSYANGPFSWSLVGRYNGGGKFGTVTGNFNQVRDLATVVDGVPTVTGQAKIWDVEDDTLGSSVYWDTRLGYQFQTGAGTLELYGNVTNLFDRDPPLVLGEAVIAQNGGSFDELGRRYVVGVNLRF